MGSFNARRKATNFTDEAFEQACRAAHLAGSRVYVTVNIVIKQSEMGDALQLIHRCSTLGADAFIIQDWGLFFEVKRTMPGIETHISTQANIHDDRGTIWCREQGADRVTLSRELSIDEIAAIHDAAPMWTSRSLAMAPSAFATRACACCRALLWRAAQPTAACALSPVVCLTS